MKGGPMSLPTLLETKREDGLRIITKKVPHSKRVRLSISALVGSAYDQPDNDGLFHFYEHMGFQGTTSRSSQDIYRLMDRYLLEGNAYTDYAKTVYYGEATNLSFGVLAALLFDIYLNSIFPPDKIEKEKEVVMGEIARDSNDDFYTAYTALWKMLWDNNPRRKSGVGTVEGVNAISRELLLDAHRKWYVPSNTVIIGTGCVEHEVLVDFAGKTIPLDFSRVEHKKWDDEWDVLPKIQENIICRRDRDIASLVYGCKLPYFSEKDWAAFKMLSDMVARGCSSLLFQEVREKRGWVYSIGGVPDRDFILGNCMDFYAEACLPRLEEVRSLMLDVICNFPLEERRFRIAKEGKLEKLIVAFEKPVDWEDLILELIVEGGKPISCLNRYTEKLRKIFEGVTFEEVVSLRQKFFTPERLAFAAVKPG